ncbi:hypothetical protein PENSPDRAFT_403578 [Peniophora sp. CONT]|nr:hypothetical protein PENSPDRAFT_403578 [Peniophora sp. CONT]
MEKATHDFLRESVEGALTRRLQGIDDDFEFARAQGMSNTSLREELVKDIDYLRTLVPQYTHRLNRRVSPLLRLPPEIFPNILCAAAPEREELISWLHLGHICHDLRSALLGMHALWADVVFDSDFRHVQEELLGRAGQSPICISIIYEDADSELFSAALRLLHRARSIDIQSEFPEHMDRIVQELEHGSYQSLEELRVWLDAPPTSSAESSLIWMSQPMIMAPKLRSLDLRNIILHVDLSSLRSLSLTLYSDEPIQDADTFITMLRLCIRLEHLEIDRWIPDCTALQNQPLVQPLLSLPHLMHLKMEQDPARILQFWPLLSIPTSASVDISFNEDFHDLHGSLERARKMRAFIAHTLIGWRDQDNQTRS